MANQRDHVLRSEILALLYLLMVMAAVGLVVYGIGFEVRDWGLARGSCARAVPHGRTVASDASIQLYAGRVVARPETGVLSAAPPGRTGRRRGAHPETSPVQGRRDRLEYGSPGVRGCRGSPSRQEEGSPVAQRSVHGTLNAAGEDLDDGA